MKFLFLILLLIPLPAKADSLAVAENVLGIIQVTDAVQTQTFLHGGNFYCNDTVGSLFQLFGPNYPPGYICHAYEGDPLARPFTNNMITNISAALAVNGLIRLADKSLFKNNRSEGAKIIWTIDVGYVGGILYPNQRIIHAQLNFHP
jgi:hypothetical protein